MNLGFSICLASFWHTTYITLLGSVNLLERKVNNNIILSRVLARGVLFKNTNFNNLSLLYLVFNTLLLYVYKSMLFYITGYRLHINYLVEQTSYVYFCGGPPTPLSSINGEMKGVTF